MSDKIKMILNPIKNKGNAGLATAYVGNKLNIKATIVVPSTTTEPVKNKLRYLIFRPNYTKCLSLNTLI